ncbi:MAG: hypothetical protein ACXABZ_14785 [Candidatus Thorarchaeota archaeon]|jgi:hypothetical protein
MRWRKNLVEGNFIILTIVVIMALLAVPSTTTGVTESIGESEVSNHIVSAEGYGRISDVPYVWQEMNGFCHNAAVTMAINAAGVSTITLQYPELVSQ